MTILAWRRRWPNQHDGDAGFTLIEVIVAMVVLSVGLLGLMAVQVGSLRTVALAKQRQTAAQLTNRVMEQLRALPYGVVTGGMSCADLSLTPTDPNITAPVYAGGSCTSTFQPTYDSSISEALVTSTSGTPVAPLSPHVQPTSATTVGRVSYVVRSYITRASGYGTGYWLTVVTTWSSPASRNVTKNVSVRSRLYSPTGCLATSTHPFSGPCQAFLYSNAGVVGGGLTLGSTRSGLGLVDGLDVTAGSITLAGLSTRVQSEQVVSAQSSAVTSGASVTGSAGTSATGSLSGVSAADTDPGTGTVTSPTAATPVTQTGSGLVRTGGGATLTLSPRSSESGSTLSTMTATATPACPDAQAIAVTTGQACSSSTVTSAGGAAATLSLAAATGGPLTLVDLAGSTTPTRSYGARFIAAGATHCAATSGVGCVTAGVTRALGQLRVGMLPALSTGDTLTAADGTDLSAAIGTTPSPLVSLTGYTDGVEAEGGVGAAAATLTRAGSLTSWNGSTFQTRTLDATTAGSYAVPAVTATYGGSLRITVSGTVTVTAAAAPVTGAAPCAATCTTKAGAGSVVAALTYTVLDGTTQVGGFAASVDLGSLLAQTTYKAAPSA